MGAARSLVLAGESQQKVFIPGLFTTALAAALPTTLTTTLIVFIRVIRSATALTVLTRVVGSASLPVVTSVIKSAASLPVLSFDFTVVVIVVFELAGSSLPRRALAGRSAAQVVVRGGFALTVR